MLAAGVGGFLGSSLRYLINRLFAMSIQSSFPWSTFIINIVGCFLFAFISSGFVEKQMIPKVLGVLLMIGFCGGFTTFSTFSNEIVSLADNGKLMISLLYLFLSVILGLIAIMVGRTVGRGIF